MSNRNMALDVIVRLKDLLTGPLRRLRSSLDGIAGMARKIGLVGGAIAAISFMGPIQQAAAFQQQLLDIAVTQGKVGKDAFVAVAMMKRQYQELARETGQSSMGVAEAAGQMIAAGLDPSLVDASIGNIARTATAANADIKDIANVATSLMQNLKLPADQLSEALDGMVIGGKLGSFELKDMSKYFPILTGQIAKLGVTGRQGAIQLAAMLQIARKGTSDPAEAANNLNNFLQKITSQETVKNFKKMNVDIMAVMQDAAIKGINPIEAVLQKISMLTGMSGKEIDGMLKSAEANGLKGAEAMEDVRKKLIAIHGAGALGELFSDMQVAGFLVPALANIEEYKKIRDQIAKADGSTSLADFNTQLEGLNRQLEVFKGLMSQISDEVGSAFGEWLPTLNEGIGKALDAFRSFNEETGGMGTKLIVFSGGVVLAAGAIGVLGFALPAVLAGLSVIVAPLRLVTGLFGMFSRSSSGIKTVADELERVNTATTKAAGLRRPSIWGMLFNLGSTVDLVNQMPTDPAGLQTYMNDNKKQWDGYGNWLEQNVGSPKSWLGMDGADAGSTKPVIDKDKAKAQQDALTGITKSWPVAAQLAMRDFLSAVTSGGDDAVSKAATIGQSIKDQLQISANPDIDTGNMERALQMARELGGTLRGIDGGQAAIGRSLSAVPMPAQASQPANVSGTINVQVTGPAQVTGVTSENRAVPITANTGRVVGRN